uniref:Uncharacterized protein n=1 Tax=viral metagenome TaxID=1070528 RepID=A0A6C0FCV0_9ZZZZ|tara:strand:+ start:16723 stop:17664 length:942 start_codon:yes stop_codon:yes gene_type:complete
MSSDTSGFTKKHNVDGSVNKKYVDVLDEDKPIANQKFVCVSFVSPENILKQRNMYMFNEFVKNYQLSKSMEKYHQFLNFISFKYSLSSDTLLEDFKEFAKEEIDDLKDNTIELDYKNFLDAKEDELQEEFNREHSFQTSVRGLKIRGTYPTQDEAELRCKMLREIDPNHDVYVGPVGMWMPWEPEAYKTGRVEYMEDELNQLMHEKNKNQEVAKATFEKRVKDTTRAAIEDNIEKAEANNTVLTQDIDEDGNLINIGTNTQEAELSKNDTVSVADIRSELFEGSDIVTTTDTDKGLGQVLKSLEDAEKKEKSE